MVNVRDTWPTRAPNSVVPAAPQNTALRASQHDWDYNNSLRGQPASVRRTLFPLSTNIHPRIVAQGLDGLGHVEVIEGRAIALVARPSRHTGRGSGEGLGIRSRSAWSEI
jgi:hypothetical protein